jgi:hypothetical protein
MHKKKGPAPAELPSDDVLLEQCGLSWMLACEENTPLAAALRTEAREQLEAAIAQLPVEYRMPLVLMEIVGFTSPEIAGITGMPEGTVRVRVHRARLALRKAIEQGLPQAAQQQEYEASICQDLLDAKQVAMDRGVDFEVPEGALTGRCKAVFASLELTQDLCQALGPDDLPATLVKRIQDGMASGA